MNNIKEVKFPTETQENIDAFFLQQLIERHKKYLLSTDWYYIRKIERNEEIPLDIIEKRQNAIDFIRENE